MVLEFCKIKERKRKEMGEGIWEGKRGEGREGGSREVRERVEWCEVCVCIFFSFFFLYTTKDTCPTCISPHG